MYPADSQPTNMLGTRLPVFPWTHIARFTASRSSPQTGF
jgi:hypothetical protein